MSLPLVEELIPAPDPWETARQLSHLPHLLFLDSADPHPVRGRYSFVSVDPVRWITRSDGDPFALLRNLLAEFPLETVPGLPPFQGGLAGLFGYGLQHVIEEIPSPRLDEFGVPDLAIGLYDWVLAWDHEANRCWAISTGYPHRESTHFAAERLAFALHERQGSKHPPMESGSTTQPAARHGLPGYEEVSSNFDRAGYLQVVRQAIDYIHAGDCFQVNISQRLLAPLRDHPLELYGRLRERNAAPFAGYLDVGDFAVASASPERFLRVANREVETRPIKGTRPRGANAELEKERIADLASSAKDRAENVMIVDLLRNDLGRVCEFGSIRVPKVCQIETYRHVHHLVSEVRGRLQDGKTPLDLLRACFPGGSVTGAPKVRAMEIIAELEPTARGPYCGSLGYVGFDGSMDTNILIRTFTAGKGFAQFPVGGGIVADSDPEREYEETLHKANGMLQSLR